MKIHGIRISDAIKKILIVSLSDILEEIIDGPSYHWNFLFLDGILNPGQEVTIYEYEEKINKSENGFQISWTELLKMSNRFFQMFDMTLVGCRDQTLLYRYESDREMYEACDTVIELIDSGYWEVFSKNEKLIARLAEKFENVKFLKPDFEK